jgi:peptide/nickel transport system substrate-binding protein
MNAVRNRSRGALAALAATAVIIASCGGNSPDDAASSDTDVTEPSVEDTAPSDSAATSTAPAEPPATDAPDPVEEPVSGGSLTVGIDGESTGWRPQNDAWGHSGHNVARTIYDTLAAYDDTGKPVPYLAESITANDDASVWTIALRPDVTFHNGEPLNAAAVQANFDAVLASPTSSGTLAQLESMRIVDDLTLELTMTEPWAAFPNTLTGGFSGQLGYVAAPAMLANPDGSRNPIGTGPFVFQEWVPDDHLTVVRNDDYWQDPAYLDDVTFRPITDSASRQRAFDNGDTDIYYTASAPEVTSYLDQESSGDVSVVAAPPSDPDVIMLNTREAPLDDVRVRQAMAHSLDVSRIIDYLEGTGLTETATGPYPQESFWFNETDYPAYDVAEATRLVDEYEGENGPIQLEYAGTQDPFIVGYQELIQSMWAEAGIDVSILSRAQAENVNAVLGQDFEVIGWGGIGGDDPDNDYQYFHSGTGLDFTGFVDADMDAALDAGRQLGDPEARQAQYDIVQDVLAENVPFLWLTFTQWRVIGGSDVRGLADFTLPDELPGRPLTGPRFYLKDVWLAS